jgi:hypothetical protein
MMERPKRDTPTKDDPDYWRAYQTHSIVDFFQSWIDNYRSLDWVTVPDNPDDGAMLSYTTRTDVSNSPEILCKVCRVKLMLVAGGSSNLQSPRLAR